MTMLTRTCPYCDNPAPIGCSSRTCSAANCKEREIREMRADLARAQDRRDATWMAALVGVLDEERICAVAKSVMERN